MILDEDVKKVIEEVLNETEGQGYVPENVIFVSELSTCLRYSFLARKMKKRVTAKMLAGKLVHDAILSKIAERLGGRAEVSCGIELQDFSIWGRADIYIPDENMVIEVKVTEPRQDNIQRYMMQLQFYMNLLRCDIGLLVFMSDEIYTYGALLDKEYRDIMIERARILYWCLKGDKLPDIKYLTAKDCKKCEFRRVCQNVQEKS